MSERPLEIAITARLQDVLEQTDHLLLASYHGDVAEDDLKKAKNRILASVTTLEKYIAGIRQNIEDIHMRKKATS